MNDFYLSHLMDMNAEIPTSCQILFTLHATDPKCDSLLKGGFPKRGFELGLEEGQGMGSLPRMGIRRT